MHVPGHAQALDPHRILVTTDAFPRFQEKLRARYPFLMLAMDRDDGLWCIVRRDPYRRRVALGWGAVKLSCAANVYTPVMHLEYVRTLPDGDHLRVFLRPGEWVFRALARLHPSHLGFDNTKRVQHELVSRDRHRRRQLKSLSDRLIADGVKDWSRHVDHKDPFRFKPSVVVAKP